MKAYHNYTTAMTTALRLRWGMATLLLLAALVVALMLLVRTNGQSTISTSPSNSVVRPAAVPIASCRACRDEWVAAQAGQPAVTALVQRPQAADMVSEFRANTPIASCRACRDEWVAAQAVQPAVAVAAQRPQAAAVLSISRANALIASCRVCRDEWIAAQEAIIPTGGVTFDQPEESFRSSGPR